MLVFIFLLMLSFINTHSQSDLVFIQIVFRHGARYPVYTHLQDGTKNHYHSNNIGLLTDVGRKNHYRLGEAVWKLYHQTFNLDLSKHQIQAMSTNYNRTRQSLYLFLSGLLHRQPQKFNGIINFDNVVYHQTIKKHIFQWSFAEKCSVLKDWHDSYHQMDIFQKIQNNKRIIKARQYLSQQYNYNYNITDWDMTALCDNYRSMIALNKPYHQIFDSQYRRQYLLICSMNTYGKFSGDQTVTSTIISSFLLEALNNMKNQIHHKNVNPHKLQIYSGHDINVLLILRVFNLTSLQCIYDMYLQNITNKDGCIYDLPPFSSNLLLELHSKSNNRYQVKIRYQLEYLRIPYCQNQFSCDFDQFENMISEIAVPNYEQICLSQNNIRSKQQSYIQKIVNVNSKFIDSPLFWSYHGFTMTLNWMILSFLAVLIKKSAKSSLTLFIHAFLFTIIDFSSIYFIAAGIFKIYDKISINFQKQQFPFQLHICFGLLSLICIIIVHSFGLIAFFTKNKNIGQTHKTFGNLLPSFIRLQVILGWIIAGEMKIATTCSIISMVITLIFYLGQKKVKKE